MKDSEFILLLIIFILIIYFFLDYNKKYYYKKENYNNLDVKDKIKYLLENNKPYDILKIKPNLNNINYINGIAWINLDRSPKRKEYMENLLKDVKIPNYRISAIDGKAYQDIKSIYGNIPLSKELSNSEIACTLSHIKAINHLKNIPGEYFIVCEDDISFDNIILFDKNLETIIKECPKFDILLLNKTYNKPIKEIYAKWSDYYFKEPIDAIYSTVCYVISRSGINKLIKDAFYIDDNNFKLNENHKLHASDIYIYENLDTYVYKYNFISTLLEESTIHNNHLNYHKNSDAYQLGIILKDFYNYNL
jgi:GR25 family glycosyltransferase involved in LPS biosynthesis